MHRLALLLIPLALACATTRPATPAPDEKPRVEGMRARDLMPLAVGKRWTYRVTAAGQMRDTTIEIVDERDGYFLDNTGQALRLDASGLKDPERYLLLEPLTEGQKWSAVQAPGVVERYEVVEAGRPCRVLAGTFGRCLVVRASVKLDKRSSLINEFTYAEGVGLVEQRVSEVQGQGAPVLRMRRELVAFDSGSGS